MIIAKLPLIYSVSDTAAQASRYEVKIGSAVVNPSTVTARLVYAGQSALTVTMTDLSVLDQISVNDSVSLSINGTRVLSATITDVSYTVNPDGSQITIDAKDAKPYAKSGQVEVSDIFSYSSDNNGKSFDAALQTAVIPGVTCATPFQSFIAGTVSYTISASNATMSVEELTAQEEDARENLEESGNSVYREQRPFMRSFSSNI